MAGKDLIRYPLSTCAMDWGANPLSLRPGVHSRVTGADARYVGGMRPFPGMSLVQALTDGGNELENITFFRYVLLQKGTTTTDHFRGWLVRHGATVGSQKLSYYYYDTNAAAWGQYDLEASGVASTASMDVAANGRFAYVTVENQADYPKVFYWDTGGGAFTSATMGPSGQLAPAAPTDDGTAGAGGFLSDGDYLFAYRYHNSVRDTYSGISSPLRITVSDGTGTSLQSLSGLTNANFDKVQILRTTRIESADSMYDAGVFFVEAEVAMATFVGTTTAGSLYDEQLVYEDRMDPWEDVVEAVPNGNAVASYQGTTFIASGDALYWSQTKRYAPESFDSSVRIYRGKLSDGPVLRFAESGDVLYAMGRSVLLRIVKGGSSLNIQRLHYGRGLMSAAAVTAIGEDLVYAAPAGLGVLSGRNATFRVFSSVDRLVLGDWSSLLTTLIAAVDPKFGATFFIEPAAGTGVVVWHATKVVTLLEDCYFPGAAEGPDILTGSDIRAFFVSSNGVVVSPDDDDSGTGTMLDVAGTINGTATGGSTSTLVDSAAAFDSTADGAYLHMLSGDNAKLSRQITGTAANTLTTATWPNANASGDRYTVSPVPFEVRLRPVPTHRGGDPAFDRRVVAEIGVKGVAWSGITSNVNALLTVGVYKELSDTAQSGSGTITITESATGTLDPTTNFARVSGGGVIVEPFVRLVSAGVNCELTGVEVVTTITDSRRHG